MQSLILPCPACRALNRVAHERLADVPVCSTCRHRLLGEPIELDEASFDAVVGRVTLPVIVDVWAPWCGPCRMMAPHFAAAAKRLAGQVVFAKVDTDQNQRLGARFGIQSIPTLALFDGGAEVRRMSGALTEAQLLQWLQS